MTDPTPTKTNLLKLHKAEYCQPKEPRRVSIGTAHSLFVNGSGMPGSAAFEHAIGGLYGMAYTIKFACKDRGQDFVVGKLEGYYGLDECPTSAEDWHWRLAIRVPEWVTDVDLEAARASLRAKGKEGNFDGVTLETVEEGDCLQLLHVGAYQERKGSVERMRAFCAEHGLAPQRWHHEIYLNDPRRVPEDKLKTLLRWPLADAQKE